MKDPNEFNVTVYVTVAVTVRGVKAATPTHAAMSVATELAEKLEDGARLLDCEAQPLDLCIGDVHHDTTRECDGSDIDGFLVETADGRHAVRLSKNGDILP